MPTTKKTAAKAARKSSLLYTHINIWISTGILLVILVLVILLARFPVSSVATHAAGTAVSLKTGKTSRFFTDRGQYSVKLDQVKSQKCDVRDSSCQPVPQATLTVTNQKTGKTEQITTSSGKPIALQGEPTVSVEVKQATTGKAVVTVTDKPVTSSAAITPAATATDVVTAPAANAVWPTGSLQTITWKKSSVTAQGVGLKLVSGSNTQDIAWPKTVRNPNGTYSSSGGLLRNVGAFDWFIPADMAAGKYKVQLVDAGGVMIAQSNEFSIVAPQNSVRIVAPTTNQTLPMGQDFLVKWNPPKFASNIDVFLYSPSDTYNGVAFIAKNIPASWIYVDPDGNGGYTWSVSDNFLSQINGNSPITIKGKTVLVGVVATDRSQTTFVQVQVR